MHRHSYHLDTETPPQYLSVTPNHYYKYYYYYYYYLLCAQRIDAVITYTQRLHCNTCQSHQTTTTNTTTVYYYYYYYYYYYTLAKQ